MNFFTAAVIAALASQADAATAFYKWTVTNTTQAPDGVSRYTLGINGKSGFSNPIIVNFGDRVVVEVTNGLSVPTSIHWHGIFQFGTPEMDGPASVTQCPIAPGATFVYDFYANQAGTYWWHGHYGTQYVDGLKGPFVIHEPPSLLQKLPYYDGEFNVLLSDWYHNQTDYLLNTQYLVPSNVDGAEPVMDNALINFQGTYNCSVPDLTLPCKEGSHAVFTVNRDYTYRMRIVNTAGFAGFTFAIDNHTMTVIEVDGVLVNPYTVDSLAINIAQRYSVLVTANQPAKNYFIRAEMYHVAPWLASGPPEGFEADVYAILNYASVPVGTPTSFSPNTYGKVLVDTDLVPLDVIPTFPFDPTCGDLNLTIAFDFEQDPDGVQRAKVTMGKTGEDPTINSNTYYPSKGNPILVDVENGIATANLSSALNAFDLPLGVTVRLTIVNNDPGEHPFHLHGHVFQVLAEGIAFNDTQLPTDFEHPNPVRRDVLTVPACDFDDNGCVNNSLNQTSFGYTVISWQTDNPGVWLFHCHIEWHIAAGLVMNFVEGADYLMTVGNSPRNLLNCKNFRAWNATHYH